MANSINTNYGSQIALQTLNATNKALETTQNRVNTGLKVGSAKDNGAIWAIAQTQRAESQSLNSVTSSLQRGQSTIDVALSAGESVSDLLLQMKELALSASDVSLSDSARASLNEDFVAKRDQISSVIQNASFDGSNLLSAKPTTTQVSAFAGTKTTYDTAKTAYDSAATTFATAKATFDALAAPTSAEATTYDTAKTAFGTAGSTYKTASSTYETALKTYNTTASTEGGFKALANASGTSTLNVAQQNLSLGGTIVTISGIDDLLDIGTDAKGSRAKAMLTDLDTSIKNVSTSLASLGTASKSFDSHLTFVGKLQDSLDAGVGNLVDADLAKESARLTALQTKQQLGVQALSIANSSSQILLSLFR